MDICGVVWFSWARFQPNELYYSMKSFLFESFPLGCVGSYESMAKARSEVVSLSINTRVCCTLVGRKKTFSHISFHWRKHDNNKIYPSPSPSSNPPNEMFLSLSHSIFRIPNNNDQKIKYFIVCNINSSVLFVSSTESNGKIRRKKFKKRKF